MPAGPRNLATNNPDRNESPRPAILAATVTLAALNRPPDLEELEERLGVIDALTKRILAVGQRSRGTPTRASSALHRQAERVEQPCEAPLHRVVP